MLMKTLTALTLSITTALLTGCASGGAGSADATGGHMAENAVNHAANPADLAALESTTPMKANQVTLWVNGLGCPQCASNADIQLKRLSGVVLTKTDLSNGKIDVTLTGAAHPSPNQFKHAIEDAGFTLIRAEEVNS